MTTILRQGRIAWVAVYATLLLAACSDGGGSNSDTDAGTDAGDDGGTDEECTDDVWVDTFDEAECPDMSGWDDCVVHVRTDGSASGDGATWATATSDIQDAVNTARCGVIGTELCAVWQVWVAEGAYYIFEKCNSNTVYLRSDVGMYGGFDGTETSLEQRDPVANETVVSCADGAGGDAHCAGAFIAFDVSGAMLDGFAITGGLTDEYFGGGLAAAQSELAIRNCAFRENRASAGGGIYTEGSSIDFVDCEFSANAASDFGGGIHFEDADALIESCTFNGNVVDEGGLCGGAINVNPSSAITIIDSTFTSNSAPFGGGVRAVDATLEFDGCGFVGNSTEGEGAEGITYRCGGAMEIELSATSISNCVFQDNTSEDSGGAVFFYFDINGMIEDSMFTGNTAAQGGAIAANSGNVAIRNCSFSDNESVYWGGGVVLAYLANGTVTDSSFEGNLSTAGGGVHVQEIDSFEATGNAFLGNSASRGGGLSVASCPAGEISNNVFTNNTANHGGGMYLSGCPPVASCTFQGNSASEGGAAYVRDSALELADSILWDNGDAGITLYEDATATVTYSDVEGGWDGGVGNIDADPLFVDAAGGDFHLQSGSPCIDAANGDLAPEFDIEGFSRIDDPDVANTGIGTPDYVDMGAYEWQG